MHQICLTYAFICIKYALSMQLYEKNMHKLCHYIDFNTAKYVYICKQLYAQIMHSTHINRHKIFN